MAQTNDTRPGCDRPGVTSTVPTNTDRPMRRRSAISQQPWWEPGTPDQRRTVAHAVAVGRELATYRRTIVLAHPDLREILVRKLGYTRADAWSGFVPPRFCEAGGNDLEQWHPNESPIRTVLLELIAEAESREKR